MKPPPHTWGRPFHVPSDAHRRSNSAFSLDEWSPPKVDTRYYAFVPEKIHPSTRSSRRAPSVKTTVSTSIVAHYGYGIAGLNAARSLADSFEGKQFENRAARQPRGTGPHAPENPNALQRVEPLSL